MAHFYSQKMNLIIKLTLFNFQKIKLKECQKVNYSFLIDCIREDLDLFIENFSNVNFEEHIYFISPLHKSKIRWNYNKNNSPAIGQRMGG